MRVAVFGLALAALLFPSTSYAKLPADLEAQIQALPLDQLCRTDGALDLSFGATSHDISPLHKPGAVNRDLGVEYAPFKDAALNATKYTHRFFSATLTVDLGDKAIEREAADLLAMRIEQAGWVPSVRSEGDDGPFHDFPPSESDSLFYDKEGVEHPGSGEGVRLVVGPSLGELSIQCESIPLFKAQVKEAFGEMPEGTPRPQFISTASAFGFDLNDCNDAGKRNFILSRLRRGDMFMMAPGADRAYYEEALADWKIMKLVASGKIGRDAIADKILGLLAGPDSQATIEAGMSMMAGLAEFLETARPGDEVALCGAIHKMLKSGEAAIAPVAGATGDAVTPQWRATHALLDREAKRLGVSFTD
jgi:hypothetical protein